MRNRPGAQSLGALSTDSIPLKAALWASLAMARSATTAFDSIPLSSLRYPVFRVRKGGASPRWGTERYWCSWLRPSLNHDTYLLSYPKSPHLQHPRWIHLPPTQFCGKSALSGARLLRLPPISLPLCRHRPHAITTEQQASCW